MHYAQAQYHLTINQSPIDYERPLSGVSASNCIVHIQFCSMATAAAAYSDLISKREVGEGRQTLRPSDRHEEQPGRTLVECLMSQRKHCRQCLWIDNESATSAAMSGRRQQFTGRRLVMLMVKVVVVATWVAIMAMCVVQILNGICRTGCNRQHDYNKR